MDLNPKEERIRKRAYVLWEEDGSMEGCNDEYWRKARELVEEEMLLEQGGAN
jgi:Protein of unknown function (DUF2934)